MEMQVARDRSYKERNKERGFVQTTVWVPAERKRELQELAAQWREEVVEEETS